MFAAERKALSERGRAESKPTLSPPQLTIMSCCCCCYVASACRMFRQPTRTRRPPEPAARMDHSRPRLPRCSNARSVHAAGVARCSTAFVVKLGCLCTMTMRRSIQTCQSSFSLPPRQRRVRAAPAVIGICCAHLFVLPLFKFKPNRSVLLCCAALLSCVCA